MLMRSVIVAVQMVLGACAAAGQDAAAPGPRGEGFIIIVQDRSGLSGDQEPIYIGSSHVNWSPNDPSMRLSPRSDMRWQIVMPPLQTDKPLEFKFTRGSWETVEVAADLSDIVNRRLEPLDGRTLAPGELPRYEFVIEKWADQRPEAKARKAMDTYRELKVTGDVRRLQVIGGGGRSLIRDALVWLPPGYSDPENAERRYPVLYMQDGQNVFENHAGVPAEWGADETAMRLIEAGEIEPLIIVGIPHSGPFRVSEYLTVRGGIEGVEAHGEDYANWLVNHVVPRIDAAFRTKAEPEHRAIGGSSLGGLVALHAGTRHPRVFGKVLAESPWLTPSEGSIVEGAFGTVRQWPRRVYLGMGGREYGPGQEARSATLVEAVRDLHERIRVVPGIGNSKELVVAAEAGHDERAWAERLPQALKFLFPAEGAP